MIFQEALKVPFVSKHLDAVLCAPASAADVHTAVILTHGAGGDMNFKHLVSLSRALASNGLLCLRFTCKGLNLGYRVKAYRAVWVSIRIIVIDIYLVKKHILHCDVICNQICFLIGLHKNTTEVYHKTCICRW